ncbi:MAG: hypothetical protein CR994_06960 [Maribacter sp.]|nr:MAG: hypothetical protein CR994_06960 [Maribacter sp.]
MTMVIFPPCLYYPYPIISKGTYGEKQLWVLVPENKNANKFYLLLLLPIFADRFYAHVVELVDTLP